MGLCTIVHAPRYLEAPCCLPKRKALPRFLVRRLFDVFPDAIHLTRTLPGLSDCLMVLVVTAPVADNLESSNDLPDGEEANRLCADDSDLRQSRGVEVS